MAATLHPGWLVLNKLGNVCEGLLTMLSRQGADAHGLCEMRSHSSVVCMLSVTRSSVVSLSKRLLIQTTAAHLARRICFAQFNTLVMMIKC